MGTEGPTVLLDPLQGGLPALDTEALSGSAACALPTRHEAVRTARDFTRRTLRRWETACDQEEVALVVSELVTNALRHGLPAGTDDEGTGTDDEGADPDGQPVRLTLMRWSNRLVCAVRDLRQEFDDPEVASGFPGDAAESGRGLFLVESFSDCWGWHRLTGARPGKVVWAMFRFPPRP